MKLVHVVLVGVRPLLMHRFGEDAEQAGNTRKVHISRGTPREEAEKVCYRDKGGKLYFPGAAISTMLCEAGGSHKQRGSRKSLKYVVPAAVVMLDDVMPMLDLDGKPLADFEVDSRPVVIPATKGRIMRHRPRLDAWSTKFSLQVNETLLDVATVQQLLTEAGTSCGLGDFRPQKRGPYGIFRVTEFKEVP